MKKYRINFFIPEWKKNKKILSPGKNSKIRINTKPYPNAM